jgi:serpin B
MLVQCANKAKTELQEVPEKTENPEKVVENPPQNLPPTLETKMKTSQNNFAFSLFKQVIEKEKKEENVFVSPLSVSMALSMAINGAEGKTEREMLNALEFSGFSVNQVNMAYQNLINLLSTRDKTVEVNIANSIWYRDNFDVKKVFLGTNKLYYDAEVKALDFKDPQSEKMINNWVSEKTNGKINKVVGKIPPAMVMYIINAIYFNGSWTEEFDKELTTEKEFYKIDGSTIPCQMMKQTRKFKYMETDDLQAVEIYYGDRSYSMTILLPKEKAGIDKLVSQFNQESWTEWKRRFRSKKGTLELPKFKLEYKIKLKEILADMGMKSAFSSSEANFSSLSDDAIWIDEVLHKTFVRVDEAGTEAAAVTSVAMATGFDPSAPFEMIADHPFLFAIREVDSGALLFIGKVMEPEFE